MEPDYSSLKPDNIIPLLYDLYVDAEDYNDEADLNLSSWQGRKVSSDTPKTEPIPDWIINQLVTTQKLENGVAVLKKGTKEIPKNIENMLFRCQAIREKIREKDPSLFGKGPILDQAKLIRKIPETPEFRLDKSSTREQGEKTFSVQESIPKTHSEWYLNLALLMDTYQQFGGEDPELKKKIEFLAINYLAKAAQFGIEPLQIDPKIKTQMEEMFQLGIFDDDGYIRECIVFDPLIMPSVKKSITKTSKGMLIEPKLFLTDTTKYEQLLPLRFKVMKGPQLETKPQTKPQVKDYWRAWSDELYNIFENISQKKERLKEFLPAPIMIDLTPFLGNLAVTNGDLKKEQSFASEFLSIQFYLEQIVEFVADRLQKKLSGELKSAYQDVDLLDDGIVLEKNPPIHVDKGDLKVWIRSNLIFINRFTINEVDVIEIVHPFNRPSFFESLSFKGGINHAQSASHRGEKLFRNFLNKVGIKLGGINGRKKVSNFLSLKQIVSQKNKQMVEYAVPGKNVLYFKEKHSFLETDLFQRCWDKMHSDELYSGEGEEFSILGKSTLNLIDGLFSEISDDKWKELNSEPGDRQLVQTSMVRMHQHLAQAVMADDFTEFSQSIELIHAEISTLLYLFSPFDTNAYESICKENLTKSGMIPKNCKVRAGIARTAVNIAAGIAAETLRVDPHRIAGTTPDSYFEYSFSVEESMPDILKNPDVSQVDLLMTEFNHNMNIRKDFKHYTAIDVTKEIEQILKAKPDTKRLNVLIDSTIDLFYSTNISNLFEHFASEIQSGRLNFIISQSGQKYSMFGMDSYYGAPFYIVNNGEEYWNKIFDPLFESETYSTDSFSKQWFCLAAKYASLDNDDYRKKIFKNTRLILDKVPPSLYEDDKPIRVSRVDDKMDCGFIDIKILGKDPEETTKEIKKLFYKKFADRKSKAHNKGSFGFYHPNLNIIGDFNVRINPGLNPEDNKIILELLDDLAKAIEGKKIDDPIVIS